MKLALRLEAAFKKITAEEQEIAIIVGVIKNEYDYAFDVDLPKDVTNLIWDWLCTLDEEIASFEEIQELADNVSDALCDEESSIPVRKYG